MAPIDARNKLDQLRKNKNKKKVDPPTNVKDLRQIIVRKKKTKGNDRSTSNRVASGRVTKAVPGQRDLRETNKRLASRRNLSQTRDNNRSTTRNETRPARPTQGGSSARPTLKNTNNNASSRRTTSNGPLRAGKQQVHQQQQYYVPPHLQQHHHHQPPTYIIAPAAAPQSNLAMDNVPEAQGASVLISNLLPSITQSEIIELFGDIGVMTAVNMINETNALVTYQNGSDAVRAVKTYHNRLLDGKPMLVHMLPNSSPASNVRSRIGLGSFVANQPAAMEITYGRRI